MDLEQRLRHVRSFRLAYAEILSAAQWYDERLGGGFYGARLDRKAEFEADMATVAELAGAALNAAGRYQVGATRFNRPYQPLLQWRDPFRPGGGLASANEVLDACDTLLGFLRVDLEAARQNERTVAFRLGWFLSFPQRARLAVGPNRVARGLAFWGSLGIGVLGSLIAAGLIAIAARHLL